MPYGTQIRRIQTVCHEFSSTIDCRMAHSLDGYRLALLAYHEFSSTVPQSFQVILISNSSVHKACKLPNEL